VEAHGRLQAGVGQASELAADFVAVAQAALADAQAYELAPR